MITICYCGTLNNKILVFNAILIYIGLAVKGPCELNFNGCCPNTQWDFAMEKCIDCPSGYVWINCSKPCEYPYYGTKCGQTCSCKKNNCDHTIGCKTDHGIKGSNISSVKSLVSNATIVDMYNTDANSSTPYSLPPVSTDSAENTLYTILLSVSIIVGVILVAYVSVFVVENVKFN